MHYFYVGQIRHRRAHRPDGAIPPSLRRGPDRRPAGLFIVVGEFFTLSVLCYINCLFNKVNISILVKKPEMS